MAKNKKLLDDLVNTKKEKITLLNVRVPTLLYEKFAEACEKRKASISEAIRHLMEQVVEEESK